MKAGNQKKITIHVPLQGNELIKKVLEVVNNDREIDTLWRVININAIDRLGMSDHGPVHFQIVSNIALRLARILDKNGVEISSVGNFGLTKKHAELIILLASLFHDLGMSISREGHEEFSLFLADRILNRILNYLPEEQKLIVKSKPLHTK